MTRILIVDDDPGLRELFVTILEEVGYVVCAADDGSTALAAMSAFAPDLIMTDLQMPVMSGWELVAKVWEEHPTLPVLLFTASINLRPPRGVDVIAPTIILAKPFSLQSLLDSIRQLTGAPKAIAGSRLPSGP